MLRRILRKLKGKKPASSIPHPFLPQAAGTTGISNKTYIRPATGISSDTFIAPTARPQTSSSPAESASLSSSTHALTMAGPAQVVQSSPGNIGTLVPRDRRTDDSDSRATSSLVDGYVNATLNSRRDHCRHDRASSSASCTSFAVEAPAGSSSASTLPLAASPELPVPDISENISTPTQSPDDCTCHNVPTQDRAASATPADNDIASPFEASTPSTDSPQLSTIPITCLPTTEDSRHPFPSPRAVSLATDIFDSTPEPSPTLEFCTVMPAGGSTEPTTLGHDSFAQSSPWPSKALACAGSSTDQDATQTARDDAAQAVLGADVPPRAIELAEEMFASMYGGDDTGDAPDKSAVVPMLLATLLDTDGETSAACESAPRDSAEKHGDNDTPPDATQRARRVEFPRRADRFRRFRHARSSVGSDVFACDFYSSPHW